MELKVEETAEPQSPQAWRNSLDPARAQQHRPFILARTANWHQLLKSMEDYVDGTLAGMSVLVAGHRGSGKTTMVASAFHELLRKELDRHRGQSNGNGREIKRPVLVTMHASQLIRKNAQPVPPAAPPANSGPLKNSSSSSPRQLGVGDGHSVANGQSPATQSQLLTESQQAEILVQMIRGLHECVSNVIVDRFEQHIKAHHGSDKINAQKEVARLRNVLEGSPQVTELEAFWRVYGVEGLGIVNDPNETTATDRRHALGIQEIQAVAALCRLLERANACSDSNASGSNSGQKNTTKDKDKGGGNQSDLPAAGAKSYLPEILGAVTGGLLVGGVAEQSSLLPAVGALTGMFAGRTAAPYWKPAAVSSQEIVVQFPPEIRKVIQLMRAAGLPPLFFVDELDKYAQDDLQPVMNSFKQFFTDQVFCCFATDADFYTWLQDDRRDDSTVASSSWFRRELFVSFPPHEFHDYLDRRITIDRQFEDRNVAYSAAERLKENLTGGRVQNEHEELAADKTALHYVLLYRSGMHMLRLHRLLHPLVRKVSEQSLLGKGGRIRTDVNFRRDVHFQVIAERVIADPRIQRWMDGSPERQQTIYDAIYGQLRALEDTPEGEEVTQFEI